MYDHLPDPYKVHKKKTILQFKNFTCRVLEKLILIVSLRYRCGYLYLNFCTFCFQQLADIKFSI